MRTSMMNTDGSPLAKPMKGSAGPTTARHSSSWSGDDADVTAPINRRAGNRPDWLKIRVPGDLEQLPVSRLMNDLALNTVCQEARCPNIFECWNAGTATFMILGEICTRRCTFCAVGKGKPLDADA